MDARRRTLFALLAAAAVDAAAAGNPQARRPCPAETQSAVVDETGDVLAVAVDRTSARSAAFTANVLGAVSAAIRPGGRVVIGSFGGKSPLPEIVRSTRMPAPSAPHKRARERGLQNQVQRAVQLISLPSDADEVAMKCELDAFNTKKAEVLAALARELKVHDNAQTGASPVVLATNIMVRPYVPVRAGTRLDVLLVTDAVEHARSMSLDPQVPSRILGAAEAAEKARQLYPGDWTGAAIHVVGVGQGSSPDPVFAARLLDTWRALIESRGAKAAEITTGSPQLLGRP